MAYTRRSDANEITAEYMDSILFEQRLIDSVVADTSTTLFGERFSMPVLTPAFPIWVFMKAGSLQGLRSIPSLLMSATS